jgi:hypothetical protein
MSTPPAAGDPEAACDAGADAGGAADVEGAPVAPGLVQAENAKAKAASGANVRDSDRFVINVVLQLRGGLADEHRSGRPLLDPISSYGDRAGLSRRRG